MKCVIHNDYLAHKETLDSYIKNFGAKGKPFGNQDRNSLKLFDLDGKTINVKSFKVPNIFNQIAYKFFRKSKAQRSFEYANKLMELGVGTPQPIAYYEFTTLLLFKKSYYISEQLETEYTYRDLTQDFSIPHYEDILRAFTRFTFQLHENNILFLDHSPGNTLIKVNGKDFKFYLVDLNRMEFKPLDFDTRIKNFARLVTKKKMIEIMSDEYAKCIGKSFEDVFNPMWQYTNEFQEKFHRKRRLKKKLKFWKKT